jgi:ribonuclease HI
MSEFVTLYTDASMLPCLTRATVAWRGKTALGSCQGSLVIESTDIHHAEMAAILHAVRDAVGRWPSLAGVFVNSDNLACVQAFWTFRDGKPPRPAKEVFLEVREALGDRWIRAKHVKAHTGGDDTRSYMNRTVDRMARVARKAATRGSP